MQPPIDVTNARFSYKDKPVFDAVTFSVKPGEFAGIIGSNGTGKSTLLRLLLGELEPEAGTVQVLGKNVHAFKDWPLVGYIPQHGLATLGSFPATAGEIVLSGLYRHIGPLRLPLKKHKEQALRALTRVGMQDAYRTLIGNLSGGQQQRVLLARVLASHPDIMLLDEPLTGIDRDAADQIYRLLYDLSRNEGLTILMVTHDISRAAGYLDRIFCLEDRTLVEVAHEQIEHELLHRHRHPAPEKLSASQEAAASVSALAPACGWPDNVQSQEERSDGNL